MKLLLTLFCIVTLLNIQCQNWMQISDYSGTAIDDGVSFTIGDTSYVGTGLSPWWSEMSEFHAFDKVSESWNVISSIPSGEERQYANGFSANGKGYVFGGIRGGQFLNDLWEYDPNTDSWANKSPLPTDGRSGSSCFVIGDTAYIVGGRTNNLSAIDEFWAYCISQDNWTQKGNVQEEAVWRGSAVSDGTFGYHLFGIDDGGLFHQTLTRYDPSNSTWTILSIFPSDGRAYSQMIYKDSALYILFGSDSLNQFYVDFWKFDLINLQWNSLENLPSSPRRGGQAFVHDEVIYYTTGLDSSMNRTTETWKFNPNLSIQEAISFKHLCYPVPAVETVYYDFDQNQTVETTIYNAQGNLVFKEMTKGEINIDGFSPGVFWVHFKIGDSIYKSKIVKE